MSGPREQSALVVVDNEVPLRKERPALARLAQVLEG